MVTYKIPIEDYSKAYRNFGKEEFKGCLFICDEGFNEFVEKIISTMKIANALKDKQW